MQLENLLKKLESRRARVLELHQGLTRNIAMSPVNGGDGEWAKAEWFIDKISTYGLTNITRYDAPDERVSAGKRPNFSIFIEGKSPRTLWVMGHLDVVPAGALELWDTDPFSVTLMEDGDTMCGRGVEDNQQAIVSATILAAELLEEGIVPELSFGILCVADEETSNTYGVDHLMANYPDIVKEGDLVVVPDFGTTEGDMIEVAEKGVLWLEVEVLGKQCHASTPEEGINTLVVASEMIGKTADIQAEFEARNELFLPPFTTITPTRILANVPNTNTISGKDVFYLDCRVLPCHTFEEIIQKAEKHYGEIAAKYGAKVKVNLISTEPLAPQTDVNSEVVVKMSKAIKEVYNIEVKPGGIGGSTVAGRYRQKGIPAVVWARVHPTYHMPNEKSKISHNIGDAKVYAHMLFGEIK